MRPRLRRLNDDSQGVALLFAAMLLPIILGMAAVTVDLTYGQMAKDRMKAASDAAATGAALALPNVDTARNIAKLLANVNSGLATPSPITSDDDIVFGMYDRDTRSFIPGGNTPNAIQVTASRTAKKGNAMPALFSGIMGVTSIDVAASSTAVQVAPPCVVVLDRTITGTYTQDANSHVLIPSCGLHVNGSGRSAIDQKGLDLQARTICAVGGIGGTMTPQGRSKCQRLDDPMARLPEPAEKGCRQDNPPLGFRLDPNCSYGGTITLSGSMVLEKGLYDFRQARIVIPRGSYIKGEEVTFFLDEGSTLVMQDQAELDLTPPKTGPYTGLALFQSRRARGINRISGSGGTTILGTLYMPNMTLYLAGRVSVGKIVAGRITVQSYAQVLINHWTGTTAMPALSATNVRTSLIR